MENRRMISRLPSLPQRLTRRQFPVLVRLILGIIGANDFMRLLIAGPLGV